MAPIPGNSWTERRFGHAAARLRSNHALQGDARVTSRRSSGRDSPLTRLTTLRRR